MSRPRVGRPRGSSSRDPAWPCYDAESDDDYRLTLVIDREDRIESDPRAARRVAWQEFVPHV